MGTLKTMADRIFVYEFITGGGMFSFAPEQTPSGSLLREGTAMSSSLAEDLARIPNTEVIALRDARLAVTGPSGVTFHSVASAEEEAWRFDSLATTADWTIVIAPEFDQLLLQRTRRVEELGGRVLGPQSHIVHLATYKANANSHLTMHGIRTPACYRFSKSCQIPEGLRFPAVVKPHDGAGSQGIQLVQSRESIPIVSHGEFLLEEFQPGTPASVAVLSGPGPNIVLPACRQHLTDDGRFTYLGGNTPLGEPLRRRAERLAAEVAATLPNCRGYLGIDMVLGAPAELDTVIELNPRITTSYVGLRRLARSSLAAAMIAVAGGQTPDLSFDAGPVEFLADGTIIRK